MPRPNGRSNTPKSVSQIHKSDRANPSLAPSREGARKPFLDARDGTSKTALVTSLFRKENRSLRIRPRLRAVLRKRQENVVRDGLRGGACSHVRTRLSLHFAAIRENPGNFDHFGCFEHE